MLVLIRSPAMMGLFWHCVDVLRGEQSLHWLVCLLEARHCHGQYSSHCMYIFTCTLLQYVESVLTNFMAKSVNM